MANRFLTDAEKKLMKIIWEFESINSTALVEKCLHEYKWKKSTTYTNLKKLVDKGFVEKNKGTIVAKITETEYEILQKREIIKKYFTNSFPKFLATFIREEKLDKEDIEELEEIIRNYKEK